MTGDRGRLTITALAVVLALLVLIFPPWTARAVRTTTRYASVPGVAPATLVDTVSWNIRALPLFAPPRPTITGSEMRALPGRARSGDSTAKRRLVSVTESFERRVSAPEVLRTAGELWRDSVLAAAGMPSVSSYEVRFAIDDVGIAMRLATIALTALLIDWRRSGAWRSLRPRGRDHKPAPSGR
jgi:hypothetical protein